MQYRVEQPRVEVQGTAAKSRGKVQGIQQPRVEVQYREHQPRVEAHVVQCIAAKSREVQYRVELSRAKSRGT